MKNINRFTIFTIVFNFLILIGAGHGVGFLGLFEIIGLNKLFSGDFIFGLTGEQDERLLTAAITAALGQIVLIFARFQNKELLKFKLIYFGLTILLFSFIILTKDFLNSNADNISFWTGVPFLASSIILLINTIKNHRLLLK